jgi:hypothetical protein
MFGRKRKQLENQAAVIDLPRPSSTIHNHAPSEAGKILAQWFVYLVLAVIGWFFLLYLVEEMGYRNPVRVMAYFLFGSAGLIILSIAFYNAVTRTLGRYWDFQLQLEEIKADRDRSLALTASQPLPNESRLTKEDAKFAALLRIAMAEAYKHLDEVGQYGPKEAKPWSRRACKGVMVPGFSDPVTEDMASRVSTWLISKGVIDKNGTINDDRERGYPTLAHFVALLESEFYVSIQVNNLSPSLRREVNFIENS